MLTRRQRQRRRAGPLHLVHRRHAAVGALAGGPVLDQVAGLAVQLAAERLERREADGAGLVLLENRQVGQRENYSRGQFGQLQLPLDQQEIQVEDDRLGGS